MAVLWSLGYFGRFVFIGLVCCLCSAQPITPSAGYYEESSLVCGEESLEYTIPPVLSGNISVQIVMQDHEGEMKPVVSDSSCGIWVTPDLDGVLLIEVEYDSCYIKKMENFYTMTVMMLHNITGEWEVFQKEDLRCPVFQGHRSRRTSQLCKMSISDFDGHWETCPFHEPCLNDLSYRLLLSKEVMDAPALNKCSGVPRANRIPCAGSTISQDICLQHGCCYDQSDSINPCYYGDKVTAQCTRDGQMLVAISKDVTMPPLILDSVHFLTGSGSDCKPVRQNDAFILFQFSLSSCGTNLKVDSGNLMYENDLIAEKNIQTWNGAFVTRDSTFRIHIRCSYAAGASEPLHVEVYTLPPPPPVSSAGPLTIEMRIAKDAQYGQYYVTRDYPVVKFLRDPVFVEVHLLNRNDPALVLMLEQCWATPSEDPLQQLQWPVLVNRCPFTGDNYRTQLVSIDQNPAMDFSSHYRRFVLSTFTFVDGDSRKSLGGLVYIHCSASVCIPSPLDSCTITCNSRKRAASLAESSLILVSSEGPLDFYQEDRELGIQGGNEDRISGLRWSLMAALGFSFSASLVGLVGVFVYLCRPKKCDARNVQI